MMGASITYGNNGGGEEVKSVEIKQRFLCNHGVEASEVGAGA